MDNYYDTQLAKMTEWIKLFQRMSSTQKVRIFTGSNENATFEGTIAEITFEDLANFAEYEPEEISAKDDIIVIYCDE